MEQTKFTHHYIKSIPEAKQNLIERGIDPNKPGYRTAGYLLGTVALHGIGMKVRQVDVDHWVVTQGILRSIDDLVDDYGLTDVSEPLRRASEGYKVEHHITTAEAEVFANLLQAYTSSRRVTQLQHFRLWPAHDAQRRSAYTHKEYKSAVLNEADTYIKLISTIEDSNESVKTPHQLRVDQWAKHFTIAGYFIDSAADVYDDYKNGIYPIRPTLFRRLSFLSSAAPSSVLALNSLPFAQLPVIAKLLKDYGI